MRIVNGICALQTNERRQRLNLSAQAASSHIREFGIDDPSSQFLVNWHASWLVSQTQSGKLRTYRPLSAQV